VTEKGEGTATEEDVCSASVGDEAGGESDREASGGCGGEWCNVDGDEGNVYMDREGFGEEVGEVVGAGNKGDNVLVLLDTTLNPIKAHVYRLTLFGSDCFGG